MKIGVSDKYKIREACVISDLYTLSSEHETALIDKYTDTQDQLTVGAGTDLAGELTPLCHKTSTHPYASASVELEPRTNDARMAVKLYPVDAKMSFSPRGGDHSPVPRDAHSRILLTCQGAHSPQRISDAGNARRPRGSTRTGRANTYAARGRIVHCSRSLSRGTLL